MLNIFQLLSTVPCMFKLSGITVAAIKMTQCLGYWKSDQNDESFDDYLKEIGKFR